MGCSVVGGLQAFAEAEKAQRRGDGHGREHDAHAAEQEVAADGAHQRYRQMCYLERSAQLERAHRPEERC